MREREITCVRHHVFGEVEQRVAQTFRHDRAARMILNERFGEQPRNRRAVLEQRVHPRIRMRIRRRRRAIDRVTAGARAHHHHAHAVRPAAVNGLKLLVIERVLPHHGGHAFDDLLVGNCAVLRFVIGDALGGVLVVLAAEAHDDVRDGLAEQLILRLAARLHRLQFRDAGIFQVRGLAAQAVGLLVIQRAHVGLGHGSRRAEHALLAATGARAVAGNERLVIAPHHQVISQRGLARIRGVHVVVKAEVFLRRVGQQARENLRGRQTRRSSSSVSRVMRSASWSPQTCTHSPQPLQRSETKMENRPPAPGVLASSERKIAGTLL